MINKANTFLFESFVVSGDNLELNYKVDKVKYVEFYKFGVDIDLTNQNIKEAVKLLWILAGISYYKAYLPASIKYSQDFLNQLGLSITAEEALFYQKTWVNGLGEFFYLNEIDHRGLINFPSTVNSSIIVKRINKLSKNIIVPLGGGKDSLVTVDMFGSNSVSFKTITVGKYPLIDKMVKKISKSYQKYKGHLTIERSIDQLIVNNTKKNNLYNGHIPISSIWASIFVVYSMITGTKYIALSNESSANKSSTVRNQLEINHQYSKSLDFEIDFDTIVRKYVHPDIRYFSALRALDELEIAKIFTHNLFPEYKNLFTSCNRNFSTQSNNQDSFWCGECAKCAFIALLFSGFMETQEINKFMRHEMFAFLTKNISALNKREEKLLNFYKQLTGLSGIKPFECVGTPEEVNKAISIAISRFKSKLLENIYNQGPHYSSDNNPSHYPKEFEKLITSYVKINTISK